MAKWFNDSSYLALNPPRALNVATHPQVYIQGQSSRFWERALASALYKENPRFFFKNSERNHIGVYKHPRPLYTKKKESFIYSLVRVVIEEKVKITMLEDYISGDAMRDEPVAQKCAECKSEGVTYTLFDSQLCWECWTEFRG